MTAPLNLCFASETVRGLPMAAIAYEAAFGCPLVANRKEEQGMVANIGMTKAEIKAGDFVDDFSMDALIGDLDILSYFQAH